MFPFENTIIIDNNLSTPYYNVFLLKIKLQLKEASYKTP